MIPRGGAPVGQLADLGPVEAGAVLCLRLWQADGDSLAGTLDPAALATLGSITRLWQDFGRRPMMRHGAACRCLGADEAWFAQLIASAAAGDHEDATMIASLMVRADVAPGLAALALDFSIALRRALAAARPAGQPLH